MQKSLTAIGFKVSGPPPSILDADFDAEKNHQHSPPSILFDANVDADKNRQHFETMVIEGKIDEEVVAAMNYVSTNVACKPAGKSTGLKAADELKCNKIMAPVCYSRDH